jgi:NAD(P)-dependent dehydrogenase (short-subunit alcohol dehydrogenase family)
MPIQHKGIHMTKAIAVAGATGELGKRVVHALLKRGATVNALVRGTSDPEKVEALRSAGATVIVLEGIPAASHLTDTACLVSTLAGLRENIIEAQSDLLDAAVAAGVPRFIPSDFSADFTKLTPGENRNLDLRREFHGKLDRSTIKGTSILNGMFADILTTPYSPIFDFKAHRVNYWGSADQHLDFTTMDSTAAFTAAAALDESTPTVLRIAGDQITPREMAAAASETIGETFNLFRLGTVDELGQKIVEARASDPTAESNVYAPFQLMQYTHNMASGRAKLERVDNLRYPEVKWTNVRQLLSALSVKST